MNKLLLYPLLLILGLCGSAAATSCFALVTPSLSYALNPDGTLKPGITGSFDARTFRVCTAPDGRPVFRPVGTAGAGDKRWQAGFGISNGADGSVYNVVQSGTNLFVGGAFTAAGTVLASNVAKWNSTTWSALGTGVNGFVSALAIGNSGDLYAGGRFSQAGGVPARYVAHWNVTAWSALGTGLNVPVHALAKGANGSLYVGGKFTTTGDGSKVIVGFGIYDSNAPLATTAATSATPAALFPNPAHGTATLRLPVGAPRPPLTLTDALGRVVRHYPTPAGPDTELDLRGLPAGTYLVHCGQFTQRLVVE